jgi:tRNA U54 and U55 pseudouridine synthase Pus10
MVRKGITSVEEEICPVLASVACGGISQRNNEIMGDSTGRGGKIVYGMAKFHASGREDMDVRMLLPPPNMIQTTKSSEDSIEVGGRPFVCEIIDAFRMPTTRDLQNVVDTINQTNTHDDEQEEPEEEEYTFVDGLFVKDDSSKNIRTKRQYGQNPNGVGIAQPLVFTSAKSFSTLQADTETKVKYYGCVCWSERPILTQQELEQCFPPNSYPLEIKQNTPIRVLHRRSAAIRIRHVLSLRCERKSDHWFILHISTSAGTYVKEFVHGDLGRTTPSISSILGCKTDIVQLDCVGIAGV